MRVLARIAVTWAVAGAVAGCGSTARQAPPPPAPPVPIDPVVVKSCADAAMGIERVTKDLRAPEAEVLGPMRRRCIDDQWARAAIECFAAMRDDELTTCVRHLPEAQRSQLVAQVIGNEATDEAVEEILAKLAALQVGIATCDQFVGAVARMMKCPALAIELRVSLGNETAGFWSLPTASLSIDARARIAEACGKSLHALQQQAADVGCMP